MLVDDGVVKQLNVEAGGFEVSSPKRCSRNWADPHARAYAARACTRVGAAAPVCWDATKRRMPSRTSLKRGVPATAARRDGHPAAQAPLRYNRPMLKQRTIKQLVRTTGVGLHSGPKVELTLRPAASDTGIVFRRVDLDPPVEFPSNADGRRRHPHGLGLAQGTRACRRSST